MHPGSLFSTGFLFFLPATGFLLAPFKFALTFFYLWLQLDVFFSNWGFAPASES
jgi:hypothetical protein